MNNKILIGSIIAVVILVLVSFTGVVGYQTTKSSTIAKASPLFTVRTQRALDEDSKDIACDYVGKGKALQIPIRDSKTALIQRVIDRVRKIDDSTFNRFINVVVNSLEKDYTLDDKTIFNIKSAFYQLRDNPDIIHNGYIDIDIDTTSILTKGITSEGWFTYCLTDANIGILAFFFEVLLGTLIWIIVFRTLPTMEDWYTCDPYSCPGPS